MACPRLTRAVTESLTAWPIALAVRIALSGCTFLRVALANARKVLKKRGFQRSRVGSAQSTATRVISGSTL